MSTDIHSFKRGLKVGSWIQFLAHIDISKASAMQKEIYHPAQRYLVISREELFADNYCYFLTDLSGTIRDFNSKMHSLDDTTLMMKTEIITHTRNKVELIHGVEKVEFVYESAQRFIKGSSYFAKHPAQVLGQSSIVSQLREINETLEWKASQLMDKTPSNISPVITDYEKQNKDKCIIV
jgi:hypothetical protein